MILFTYKTLSNQSLFKINFTVFNNRLYYGDIHLDIPSFYFFISSISFHFILLCTLILLFIVIGKSRANSEGAFANSEGIPEAMDRLTRALQMGRAADDDEATNNTAETTKQ